MRRCCWTQLLPPRSSRKVASISRRCHAVLVLAKDGCWWDLDNYQSSGIILYQPGDDVHLQRNIIRNNDAGIALWGGNQHNVIHNTVTVTEADPGENGVSHYGCLVLETENSGLRQNTISSEDGDVGIVVYSTAENAKLIGNDISGFDEAIVDSGDETKLPDPFDTDA